MGKRSQHPFSNSFPMDNTTVPATAAKRLRQGYWAAVSFTDFNIGRVLDALQAGPHVHTTIVCFWGDHGYQLGDNDLWAKMTNFEHATRIPLMISIPGATEVPGRSDALVEELDHAHHDRRSNWQSCSPLCCRCGPVTPHRFLCGGSLAFHAPPQPWHPKP